MNTCGGRMLLTLAGPASVRSSAICSCVAPATAAGEQLTATDPSSGELGVDRHERPSPSASAARMTCKPEPDRKRSTGNPDELPVDICGRHPPKGGGAAGIPPRSRPPTGVVSIARGAGADRRSGRLRTRVRSSSTRRTIGSTHEQLRGTWRRSWCARVRVYPSVRRPRLE
jgi:hypothetical protein